MQALSAARESDSTETAADGAAGAGALTAGLGVFAARPAKRCKLCHHEMAPVGEPAATQPEFVVSRHLLDTTAGAEYQGFGEVEMHERAVKNYAEELLMVMADSPFNPEDSILYYELETKNEALVVSMAIERRYVGLDLIGGTARDMDGIVRAAEASQPSDPLLDIRTDSRFPLALKSRFLQDPLNTCEWAVRDGRLSSDGAAPVPCPQPATRSMHRIGLLLDLSSLTLCATRDGKIAARTRVDSSVAALNRDIGLLPVFELPLNGSVRVHFADPSLPNLGFKFDLDAYKRQRQDELVTDISRRTTDSVPYTMFRDYFEYYGYEQAARACNRGQLARASVPGRVLVRSAVMSGRADELVKLLPQLGVQASVDLQARIAQVQSLEWALGQLAAGAAPAAADMGDALTYDAAVLLVTPNSPREHERARRACLDAREALLDQALAEMTQAASEKFTPGAFHGKEPVLRDLVSSFNTNIALKPRDSNGRAALLRGFLQREYPDSFPD